MPPAPSLLWLRNDLRIDDHAPLRAAHDASDGRVVPVYCFDPRHFAATDLGFPKTGPRRARFLIEALTDLRARFQSIGADLVLRIGPPERVLPELAAQLGARAVFAHHEPCDEEQRVEQRAERALSTHNIALKTSWGATLYHPDDLPFDPQDTPEVFTDFRKRVEKRAEVRAPVSGPSSLGALPDSIDPGHVPTLGDLGLDDPGPVDPRAALAFQGGATAVRERLAGWIWTRDRLRRYKETRNGLLGPDYSSKLSPWLALGTVSPRRVWSLVQRYERERVKNSSTYWLIFELIWRDFFRFQAVKHGNALFYVDGFQGRRLPWRHDRDAFERWRTGTTGLPFIDANMRELMHTGFMSNRGRQNVASFLAKTLGIDWRWGAAWFESALLDYDPCSNWGNWQYAAGVGNDPRDRVFNILSQAHRYDPKGDYVRHWLPMLADLPDNLVHEPYALPPRELAQRYGVSIGVDYPQPMLPMEQVKKRGFKPSRR